MEHACDEFKVQCFIRMKCKPLLGVVVGEVRRGERETGGGGGVVPKYESVDFEYMIVGPCLIWYSRKQSSSLPEKKVTFFALSYCLSCSCGNNGIDGLSLILKQESVTDKSNVELGCFSGNLVSFWKCNLQSTL